MTRTLRTLLLSATALGALATAAMAAPPSTSPSDGTTAGMTSMHATGTMQMHTGGMTEMHTGASMATMHRDGGHEPASHHPPQGGDRS